MDNQKDTRIKSSTIRHYIRVGAFVVLGASVGAFLMLLLQRYPYLQSSPFFFENKELSTVDEGVTTSVIALPRSGPVNLKIPKLNLDVSFEESLGLNSDKTIQVPKSYEKVGWYKFGPTPGEIGPAVVLGHVDSLDGPAVFFTLGQLTQGDEVYITRQDGSVATFKVTKLERYSQDEFPTELVYGKTSNATLRLITCTGIYDRGSLRYSHNLVVYAELVNVNEISKSTVFTE